MWESNLWSYSKPKIDHFCLVFKGKKGEKRSRHWYRVFNWCVEQCLEAVAKQILPNRTRYDVTGKARQEFSSKMCISDDSKIFLQICTVDLLSTSSAWQASVVENVKLKHDLDTIFWDFWAESIQCVVVINISTKMRTKKYWSTQEDPYNPKQSTFVFGQQGLPHFP